MLDFLCLSAFRRAAHRMTAKRTDSCLDMAGKKSTSVYPLSTTNSRATWPKCSTSGEKTFTQRVKNHLICHYPRQNILKLFVDRWQKFKNFKNYLENHVILESGKEAAHQLRIREKCTHHTQVFDHAQAFDQPSSKTSLWVKCARACAPQEGEERHNYREKKGQNHSQIDIINSQNKDHSPCTRRRSETEEQQKADANNHEWNAEWK